MGYSFSNIQIKNEDGIISDWELKNVEHSIDSVDIHVLSCCFCFYGNPAHWPEKTERTTQYA